MPEDKYTCFVISPISGEYGDEEARERLSSFNNVYEYLILNSLRLAGFGPENITRSDREARSGRVSDSIMAHLKNDDLCIVDLTGLNPNAMYEYGVRVGVGKPAILIASYDTSLPFDVKDEHTIIYDMNDIGNVMKCQERLETFVRSLMSEGFVTKSGADSYAELSERLKRIENDLAQLIARGDNSISAPKLNSNAERIIRELGSTTAAFNYALRNKDVVLGEDLMPRLEATTSKEKYIDMVVAQLASLGSRKAASVLKSNWEYIKANLSLRQQYEEIACYISYCNRSDEDERELGFISMELEDLENRVNESDLSDNEKKDLKSGIYNQTNRLYYGAYKTASMEHREAEHISWLSKAIDSIRKAIDLNPNEASYYYNLAICYREAKQIDEAEKAISQCVKLGTKDSDHLSLAYRIHIEAGKGEEARLIKEQLEEINPYAAALL